MIVVSHAMYERLCHPEKKWSRPLKPEELIARDSFTGETMVLQTPEEIFGEPEKPKKGKPQTEQSDSNGK